MRTIFILSLMILLLSGCSARWTHPQGYGEDILKEDISTCRSKAVETIKQQFGFNTCKEYALEMGMQTPAYVHSGSLFVPGRGSSQPVPSKWEMNKALKKCNPVYESAFEDCMKEKGWQRGH